jgi:hypothetical protein
MAFLVLQLATVFTFKAVSVVNIHYQAEGISNEGIRENEYIVQEPILRLFALQLQRQRKSNFPNALGYS